METTQEQHDTDSQEQDRQVEWEATALYDKAGVFLGYVWKLK